MPGFAERPGYRPGGHGVRFETVALPRGSVQPAGSAIVWRHKTEEWQNYGGKIWNGRLILLPPFFAIVFSPFGISLTTLPPAERQGERRVLKARSRCDGCVIISESDRSETPAPVRSAGWLGALTVTGVTPNAPCVHIA